jgi:predicted dehydrogenase
MMLAGEQSWTPLDPPEAASAGVEASYVMGLSHMVDCLLTGEKPVLDGRRGRHVLAAMLAAKESASTSKAIELEPPGEAAGA